MRLNNTEKTLAKVRELPTLPVIAHNIQRLLGDPRSSAQDLAEIIEKDQSITAKVLKLVNSAAWGLPEKVTNIAQAISLLGYRSISHMVTTLAVFDSLQKMGRGSFDRRAFWIHSIASAVMSRKIAERTRLAEAEDAFTAGLLHDMGKVFMDGFLNEDFAIVLRTAEDRGISFLEAEHLLLEVDHAVIGEWISRAWQLPLFIVAAVKHHHQEPEERRGFVNSDDAIVDIVRAADVAVRSAHRGKNGDGRAHTPALTPEMLKRLPLSVQDFPGLLKDIGGEIEKAAGFLTLAMGY
jgi:HD-like signal output (HDOD) protein